MYAEVERLSVTLGRSRHLLAHVTDPLNRHPYPACSAMRSIAGRSDTLNRRTYARGKADTRLTAVDATADLCEQAVGRYRPPLRSGRTFNGDVRPKETQPMKTYHLAIVLAITTVVVGCSGMTKGKALAESQTRLCWKVHANSN